MAKLAVVFVCSALAVGCSSVSVDCAPLVSDGTRCVCPEGSVQVDDWLCELPDGGVIRRPGAPDAGQDSGLVMLDSGVDALVAAPDAANLDADASAQPDVAVLCGLPPRITVGHPEIVPVSYTLENIGDADSAAVVFVVELFDELSSAWRKVHESTVAARVRVAEVRTGSVDIALPDFVVSGTNRFRCGATTSDAAALSNVEGEFSIDVTPDLALQSLGLPTGAFTSETMAVFTVANLGAVATLQAFLDIDAGNEFGGGWMTYRGSPDEGTASAIIGPLRAGETRVESTTGWCFYRLDDLEVRGRVLDRSRMDLDVEDNWRRVPHRVSFRPGPECFPE